MFSFVYNTNCRFVTLTSHLVIINEILILRFQWTGKNYFFLLLMAQNRGSINLVKKII
uniref:Uncharacterized protein n=1 Tax=Anguilla anguilla TaxID=7936 RepID=A0A0E9VMI3_ANGAN